ncbi:LytTR family DNA-binding domain-containing protein [Mesorhizobium sp. GbtcB19]|uniref:LytTR family DNA-binding domain-containing protein n=1 Tax=Mesorhizobium sp. GbtcB19 TaxID=2824764 RepID=UPI001C2F3399|nr:LytTR family DNA-binding domain-containing protein [Mesorhizobium sp. GbtcB19]
MNGLLNVTKSASSGLDAASFGMIAAGLALVDLSNVFTLVHNSLRHGPGVALWIPCVAEASSGLSALGAVWIIASALRLASPGRAHWGRVLLVHVLASLFFSAQHVLGMVALRKVIYGVMGSYYQFELGDWLYEYRKDALTYLIIAALLVAYRSYSEKAKRDVAPQSGSEPTFDIAAGVRTIRVPLRAVLALRAAGNYVEVLLDDGRRPLVRGTLSSYAERLVPSGFERTHRSWLVNGARVTGLRPAGSGDMHVDLPGGYEAPLSRRFPEALRRLKDMK